MEESAPTAAEEVTRRSQYAAAATAFEDVGMPHLLPAADFLSSVSSEQNSRAQWAYGELTDAGADFVLAALLVPPANNTADEEELFVDLGSGRGKVVMLAACLGIHSCGIEMEPTRHSLATAALELLGP